MKVLSVKRVVITSSMVTLIPFEWLTSPDSRVYTAKDINPNPSRVVSSSMEAYWTSKTLARSTVHQFIEAYQPHFSTVQILPGVIIGPDDRASSITELRNKTPLWELKLSPILGYRQAHPMVGVPIDVGDVARAHVDAIGWSVTGNRDYILSSGYPEGIVWDSMINVARSRFGDRCGGKELPLGGSLPTTKWRVDCRETEDVFGWKFSTFEVTIERSIGQYLELLDAEQ